MEKTNVMRLLEQKKISYQSYCYDGDASTLTGVEIANAQNQNPEQVFKTLVTISGKNVNYVFVVPVAEELDLKKAAKAVGEKSISMLKSKELLPLTGYVHGGCSPIGMKKAFRTVIHQSAESMETIIFSAGKIGCQVEVKPSDLSKIIRISFADIIVDKEENS